MNSWKYHDITCRNHTFLNPSSTEKLDELISLLEIKDGARVLDMGCGKAEALIRVAGRHIIKGVGVDLSPNFIADARAEAGKRARSESQLEFLEMAGEDFRSDEPFDVAFCLGASWIFGGLKGSLESLQQFLKPGGLLAVGEPYWIKAPTPEYLQQLSAAGMEVDAEFTHAGNIEVGINSGLIPIYSLVSTQADWDHWEWHRYRAAELYALRNTQDPDNSELLRRARATRDIYLNYNRDCLGWSLYLFVKP